MLETYVSYTIIIILILISSYVIFYYLEKRKKYDKNTPSIEYYNLNSTNHKLLKKINSGSRHYIEKNNLGPVTRGPHRPNNDNDNDDGYDDNDDNDVLTSPKRTRRSMLL